MLLVFMACVVPEALSGVAATAGMEVTQPPFLDITVTPRDAGRIVIMKVDTDSSMNISRVSLLLPARLEGSEIYVNDIRMDVPASGGEEVELDLSGKVSDREVTIVFKSNGQPLATCTISVGNPLAPGGDCGW